MPSPGGPSGRPDRRDGAALGEDWRPSAGFAALRRRAELLAAVRRFFAERGVLEVETPVLAAATVPDTHLASLATEVQVPGAGRRRFWLQTSPEYAMKRLLAAGSGPIYQVARVFRDEEAGRLHNPEFTLVEWYRPGFDLAALMDEMDALLAATLGAPPARRVTYGEAFAAATGLDPHRAPTAALREAAARAGLGDVALDADDRDGWMQLLLTHRVEPDLGGDGRPAFLHDYPASQAALARLRPVAPGEPTVASRFEVYLGGVELANGFHELADADEQRRRFEDDRARRRALGLPVPALDERFLAALAAGLPDCSGVALGFDRLVMVALGAATIADVLAFPAERA